MLAEGPETGLSIAQAFPEATVMVTLSASNFRNVQLKPEQKEIILCLDNDGKAAQSYQDAIEAARILTSRGHTVYMAMPDALEQDFNDVHLLQGIEAVRDKVEAASLFNEVNRHDKDQVFPDAIQTAEATQLIKSFAEKEGSKIYDMTEIIPHLNEINEMSTLGSAIENSLRYDHELASFNAINKDELPSIEDSLEYSEIELMEDEFNLDIE